ncbi:unnamed protein product [Schistosoma margrebowiei]|uniref:Uncharacterized protein n=1 Tax=Schistosoma margrebowiei TaxID=48269 RepID=A0A3P8CBY5_9TREM|nr:unnamed protein product [Schistosoma margrebowiei]
MGIQQNGVPNWHFLGVLTNEKPSAIYKVGKLAKSYSNFYLCFEDAQLQNVIHPFGTSASFQCSNGVVPAQIGISVDLLTNLPQQTEEITSEPSVSADRMTQFTRFAAESLFNYVASFARDNSTSDPLVPMSAIKGWFDTMLQKLSLDASFWRK